jgi:hypothetical protein
LLYVVVYKTDKGGIAGTNNSHLFFAHKLFEFSHDYLNILICGEAHHQSCTIHFDIRLICMLKPQYSTMRRFMARTTARPCLARGILHRHTGVRAS